MVRDLGYRKPAGGNFRDILIGWKRLCVALALQLAPGRVSHGIARKRWQAMIRSA